MSQSVCGNLDSYCKKIISHTSLGAIVKLTAARLTLLFLKPIKPNIIRNVGKNTVILNNRYKLCNTLCWQNYLNKEYLTNRVYVVCYQLKRRVGWELGLWNIRQQWRTAKKATDKQHWARDSKATPLGPGPRGVCQHFPLFSFLSQWKIQLGLCSNKTTLLGGEGRGGISCWVLEVIQTFLARIVGK